MNTRVLLISKACLVGTYQTKLEALAAQPDIDLGVLVPPTWDDPAGQIVLERAYTDGYTLWVDPIRFNGRYHFHYYPSLPRRLREFQPHILHIDEEPYNIATAHALWHGRRAGARALFFTWQNIHRVYPLPFRLLERWVLRTADYAVMGNRAAVDVFRRKGYTGSYTVIPQFGVAADLFTPPEDRPDIPVVVGFAGRLVAEKGVDTLLHAAARLQKTVLRPWRIEIVGDGPQREAWEQLTADLGLTDRVKFAGVRPSADMPDILRGWHLLVLPSRTRPNWKEQFGRILVEAMACETAVVGSDSGEIPHVIGDAGRVFAEGDASALADHLHDLIAHPARRRALARAGRQRMVTTFTQRQIAARTAAVYREMTAQ